MTDISTADIRLRGESQQLDTALAILAQIPGIEVSTQPDTASLQEELRQGLARLQALCGAPGTSRLSEQVTSRMPRQRFMELALKAGWRITRDDPAYCPNKRQPKNAYRRVTLSGKGVKVSMMFELPNGPKVKTGIFARHVQALRRELEKQGL